MPQAKDVLRVRAGPLDKTRALQRKLYRAAKQSGKRRFHALYDKVHRADILGRAWEEVARKGGAAGVDGMTIEAVEEEGVEAFLSNLQQELAECRYRPLPVRRVTIPKRNGGQRHLGVPAVRDRVVQAAAKLVLEPIFEADFAECSFGFRPRRSALMARERIRSGLRRYRRWAVDADIKGFFDHLDHGILLGLVGERVSDRRVLKLLRSWLRAGVLAEGSLLHPDAGTPQGGVISPLLANVYLHRLDKAWQEHGQRLGELTRYADDLVVLCRTAKRAATALAELRRLLAELGLELSEAKTRVVDCRTGAEGFDFLGFHFRMRPTRRNRNWWYAASWPSQAAVAAARNRVRDLTPLARIGLPTIVVVQEVNAFLRGWGAYFRYGNSTQQFHQLDAYVMHRVACFIARKHKARTWRRGLVDLLGSHTGPGLYRLVGTVRYASA